MKSLITLALASLSCSTVQASELNIQHYNPQEQGIFPVSSTLITGPTEAMLIDSQFSVKDGEKLVKMIKDSGKNLKSVLITSGDPDFYFGLEPVINAFPKAKVFATETVVNHIKETKDAKLAYWGPKLDNGAPSKIILPETITDYNFYIDGQEVELRNPKSYASYVWIPSTKTLLGGTGLSWGIHLWTADTQTTESRSAWMMTLKEMAELQPERVIPGHYLGILPLNMEAITFTSDYLNDFEQSLSEYKTSGEVINAMKRKWPTLREPESLDFSAKVNLGDITW